MERQMRLFYAKVDCGISRRRRALGRGGSRIAIEGTEYGFVGVAENGDDLDLIPADTEEEARADIDYAFAGYDTFRWLEED